MVTHRHGGVYIRGPKIGENEMGRKKRKKKRESDHLVFKKIEGVTSPKNRRGGGPNRWEGWGMTGAP